AEDGIRDYKVTGVQTCALPILTHQLDDFLGAFRLAERAKEVVKLMGHIQQEFENDVTKDSRPFHLATGVTTLIYQLGRPLRQLRSEERRVGKDAQALSSRQH